MFAKEPGHAQYFADDISGLLCGKGEAGTDNILNNTAKMWVSPEKVVCTQTVLL